MKKYIIPSIHAVAIEAAETLLQSSYTEFGGKTDRFDARMRMKRNYDTDYLFDQDNTNNFDEE